MHHCPLRREHIRIRLVLPLFFLLLRHSWTRVVPWLHDPALRMRRRSKFVWFFEDARFVIIIAFGGFLRTQGCAEGAGVVAAAGAAGGFPREDLEKSR